MPAPKFKPNPEPGTRKFRECLVSVLEYLQEELPCSYPARVRIMQLEGEYGYCDVRKNKDGEHYFLIVVCKGMDFLLSKDTLLHEYAHALCWESCPDEEPHGPEWGVAFSRVYRTAIGGE